MTMWWMAYGLLVGTLFAVAARGLDGVLRLGGRRARWVWAGALGLTLVLTAVALRTSAVPARIPDRTRAVAPAGAAGARPDVSLTDRLLAPLASLRRSVAHAARNAMAGARQHVPASLDYWLALVWFSCSALLLAALIAVHVRVRRVRRAWPPATLHDVRVRLAPRTGPVVLGLLRPEIVVPRWLLLRTGAEQRLVLAHEREHLRAGDPLLLAAACAVAALLPWHPAVWWMLARLRLSVELDCDARVLRRGAAPRSYGALLIDLAGSCTGFGARAPALGDSSSHLERRLIAMTPHRPRFLVARGGILTAIAAVALVIACDAPLPTAADVSRMDVAKAEQLGQSAHLLTQRDSLVYVVNGVVVSAKEAHAVDHSQIATINLVRNARAAKEIRITTQQAALYKAGAAGAASAAKVPVSNGRRVYEVRVTKAFAAATNMGDARYAFSGLTVIDGVPVANAVFSQLDPSKIKSIEVLKGPAAMRLFTDPKAANGVIAITTNGSAR